jgi:NTP pyrophosphatase (non-canonical NTP hydrolase)
MYYIYHIPGKKIGVTANLNKRVTKQQGYKFGEYEVLEASDDISYISNREIELQKLYEYKVDLQTYESLIKSNNKMKINITEQTTTFPCPANKLKGQLMDNLGMKWETIEGSFEINTDTIPWIVKNVKTSMYNNDRCYIYNKAFSNFVLEENSPNLFNAETPTIFDMIRDWAKERGIYEKGDSKTQYIKLMEEAGELAQALLKNDKPEVIDAIGDIAVVLTNLAYLEGMAIEDCVSIAYNEISNRKGKMINGTFVKQTL